MAKTRGGNKQLALLSLVLCLLLTCNSPRVTLSFTFLAPLSAHGPPLANACHSLSMSEKNSSRNNSVRIGEDTSSCSKQQRPRRTDQIDRLQGVWWTSDQRDQLVHITSSYATFDNHQMQETSSPPVMYTLGGTDHIVTLRTFKLLLSSESNSSPQWVSSPVSKASTSMQRRQVVDTWERCLDVEKYWKSNNFHDLKGATVPGYEESLSLLLMSGGSHWSSSPVDIIRACIKGAQSKNARLVSSAVVESASNERGILALTNCTASTTAWSIVKCSHFSPDVCVIQVSIGESFQKFQFCLSRDQDRERLESRLPPSLLFDSTADIELYLKGKVWMIDHIRMVC